MCCNQVIRCKLHGIDFGKLSTTELYIIIFSTQGKIFALWLVKETKEINQASKQEIYKAYAVIHTHWGQCTLRCELHDFDFSKLFLAELRIRIFSIQGKT